MRPHKARPVVWLVAVAACAGAAVEAGVLRQLTDTAIETFSDTENLSSFAIDDAGTFVVTASTEDEGGNPNNDPRLVGWTLPAGSRSEIVPFPVLIGNISVSDDGQWIAFVSAADPVGQNQDGSVEAFLVSRDGTTIRQLTNRSSFEAPNPRPVLSGSANRLLFIDTGNPLGSNPAGLLQLFVIDASGLNLRQLTGVTDPAKSFCDTFLAPPAHSVDDAGRRVVFAHNGNLTGANPGGKCQLFRIGTDGNLLTQITAGSVDSTWPVLSGDGTKAAYWVEATDMLHVVDYQTGVSAPLVAGYDPSITDNGQWLYYADGNSQLFKIPTNGGAATQLTGSPVLVDEVEVSGANTAVAIGAANSALPGGSNPDESLELWVTDINGNGAQQLTDNDADLWIANSYYIDPDITPDGSRIVVIGPRREVYRVNADGSDLTRLSFPSAGETAAEHVSVGQDGDSIVFDSWLLTPPLQSSHVFALRDDGTDLFQLASEFAVRPVLGKMSNLAVFQGASGGSLYKVQADIPGATQFTADGSNQIKFHRIDYDAEWVVYGSPANPLGTNPDNSNEIFRVRTDGTGLQQLTSVPSGFSYVPDISADGSRVVFVSNTDPVGLNPDGNYEIFLIDVPTNVTQQLTVTTGAPLVETMPRISGNGTYVFFESEWGYFAYPSALYRMEIATGDIERCDGIPSHAGGLLAQDNYTAGLTVDYSGDRVAFVGWVNGTGENGDGSNELFLADFAATPQWEISGSQPTVLSFEPDPRGARYDILRGDLANLAPGPGGTVDLGPVVCLENDSTDTTTIGFGDPALPAPGEGFFFLFRFTQGPPDGPGSWGEGTGGAEHVPGFGACAD